MLQCYAPWAELALPLIKKWEGLKLTAYKCPADVWTIGYGQTGPHIRAGLVWTLAQAEEALAAEVLKFGRGVDSVVKVELTPGQKAACVSLAYNVGLGAFKSSTLLRLLNRGSTKEAAEQFLRWNRAGGRALAGLTNRRREERALFLRA